MVTPTLSAQTAANKRTRIVGVHQQLKEHCSGQRQACTSLQSAGEARALGGAQADAALSSTALLWCQG